MAVGIPFDEANTVLIAPTPEDAAVGTVYDLHVHRYRDLDNQPHVISKWQLTPEELADVVASGGIVWFHSWGATHPPVSLSGHSPFPQRPGQGEPPRRLDVDDPTYEPTVGPWVVIHLDGAEQSNALAYDIDAGTIRRMRCDDQGTPIVNGDEIETEVVHGTVTVSWKA